MKVLHLTLKRKWFDMIASGEKTEEYREIKRYWTQRLGPHKPRYDAIQFRNGYAKDAPTMLVEMRDLCVGRGLVEWGAPADEFKKVFILRLGKILKRTDSAQ